MTIEAITEHAQRHLAPLGNIEVTKPGYRTIGSMYTATVILTRPDSIEHYNCYAGGGAVAMTLFKTEHLPELPLFGGNDQ